MKKVNLFVCTALLIAGCKGSGNGSGGNSSASINDTTITNSVSRGDIAGNSRTAEKWNKTLDGIDKDKAAEWIKNYEATSYEAVSAPVNFFMSRYMIEKVVKLLRAEQKNTPAGQDTTDGARFYFARKVPKGPLSLLLIATKKFPRTTSQLLKSHEDYFLHESTEADDLFSDLSALEIKSYDEKVDGARLYDPKPVRELPCVFHPNYIPRKQAYEMIKSFKVGKMNSFSEFFDIDLFESFLTDEKLAGIRIYLGRHNDKHPFYPNQLALVLCSTHSSDGKLFTDFFSCSSIVESSYLKKDEKDPYNNGHLCPTNCNVLPPPPPPSK